MGNKTPSEPLCDTFWNVNSTSVIVRTWSVHHNRKHCSTRTAEGLRRVDRISAVAFAPILSSVCSTDSTYLNVNLKFNDGDRTTDTHTYTADSIKCQPTNWPSTIGKPSTHKQEHNNGTPYCVANKTTHASLLHNKIDDFSVNSTLVLLSDNWWNSKPAIERKENNNIPAKTHCTLWTGFGNALSYPTMAQVEWK